MGSWYWIGVAAGLGLGAGVAIGALIPEGRRGASAAVAAILAVAAGIGLGFLVGDWAEAAAGAIGGLLAFRFIKKATPPKPELAIEEAQLIRETVAGTQRPGTAVPEIRR